MSAAEQLDQQYPGLLDATSYVESRGDPNAISPKGAIGAFQFMPATAAHYGIDPHNYAQSREAAAQNIQEGLRASGGDIDGAMRYFHAGPTAPRGPANAAYPGLIMAALQRNQGGHPAPQSGDDLESIVSGKPSAPVAAPSPHNESLESIVGGGNGGGNAGNVPVPAHQEVGDSSGGNGGVVHQVQPDGGNGLTGSGVQAGSGSGYAGGPGGQPNQPGQDFRGTQSPEAPQEGIVTSVGKGLHDTLVGSLRGFGSMAGTGATLLGKGFDATGLTTGAGDNALKNSDALQSLLASREYNPNGWGNMGGEIASALPLAEIKLLQAAKGAGFFTKLGLYGAQGGLAGLGLSGGHDMLWNTGVGTGAGMVLGPAGEKIIAPLLSPVLSKAKLLINALREAGGGEGATVADAEASYRASMASGGPKFNRMSPDVQSGIAEMIDGGKSAADIAQAYPEWANTGKNAETIDWWVKHRAAGGRDPVSFQSTNAGGQDAPGPLNAKSYADAYTRGEGRGTGPADLEMQQFAANNGPQIEAEFQRRAASGAQPSSADIAAALRNGGAGRGIESVTALPAKVADDMAARANGVPDDHALRDAAVRYTGGEPTVGTTTRDPEAQRLEKTTANMDGGNGAALAQRAADNNAALHATTDQTITGYGGKPEPGDASIALRDSLAADRDAKTAIVSKAYADAETQEPGTKVNTDSLRELLDTPQFATSTNAQVRDLANGLKAHLDAVDARGGTTLRSPSEIEDLRQLANDAWDKTGGKVNGAIGKVGGALDESLDQLDQAGPAFKQARALHRQVASEYSDPKSIADLIRRDTKGNFINADAGAASDNKLLNGADTTAFHQVLRQAQANGDTAAIDRLKAEVVQRAYEKATGTAADKGNKAVFSPSGWRNSLNSMGMGRLNALFSTDEMAHLATIHTAAQALHEAVPGAVNGSHSATTLLNATGLSNALDKVADPGLSTAAKLKLLAARVAAHGASLPLHATGAGVGAHWAVENLTKTATAAATKGAAKAAQKDLSAAIQRTLNPDSARTAANENAARAVTAADRKVLGSALGRHAATAAAASKGNR